MMLLENVTLTYPDGAGHITALDDVSLRLPPGELAVLVGPSGSGKSSLLAVAATLITPDTGTVSLDGEDVTGWSARERTRLRRERVGLVFQEPNLLASLTALEQLTVTASLAGRSRRSAAPEARELLAAVGMAEYADRRPAQLSGGQRQRVNIARGLVGSPSVLLVDEPTSALDHERGAEVMALLRELTTTRDIPTLVVTHDTALLQPDDRVLRCVDGRVSAAAPAELSEAAAAGSRGTGGMAVQQQR